MHFTQLYGLYSKFNADFSYLRLIKGKTYELYMQFTQLCFKIITLFIGLQFLFNVDIIFCIFAIVFAIFKGLIDFKPIKEKIRLTKEQQRKSIKHGYLYELMIGIKNQKELMIYRAFDFLKQKWKLEKVEYDKTEIHMQKINSKFNRVQESMSIVFNALIIIIFANLVKENNFTIGNYVLITMAVNVTTSNIYHLINQLAQMLENYTHYETVHGTAYYSEKYIETKVEGTEKFKLQNQIKISNLRFTYPNSKTEALDGIDLLINKGDTVVILGENGSGKSTLIKVLLGLYQVRSDSVLIDGIPINQFNKNSIYKKVSVVFQDYIQYHTTIKDNVGIGDIENYKDSNHMYKVLRHVDIKLNNNNLETKVGYIDEESINLSGGQWQRLALSRFYFKKNPEIAIFDEATAALDPMTEVRHFNDILTQCEDITTIIVSHRVGIAKRADKIVVMENGRILEQGTHTELIEIKGTYYNMWMTQKEWYQEEDKVTADVKQSVLN
ncbi:ATP-binding cassette domain-containing protein [Paenibacillus yanchengensis]